jgi:hypothetical protein
MKRLLGVAALAIVLALAGCGTHGRLASSGTPAVSTPATHHPAAPLNAKNPKSTPQSAQLAAIQQALTGLNSSLNSIDSNITQADKAADSDQ